MLTDEDKQWTLANVATKEWTWEEIGGLETRLSAQVWKWASPIEERVRSQPAVMRALDADLEWIKDRVKKLEDDFKKFDDEYRSA